MSAAKRGFLLAAPLLLSGAFTEAASALLVADWTFDAPVQTVGSTETVLMAATFFNDAASDENLVAGSSISFTTTHGTLVGPDAYTITQNSSALVGLDLAPGESFSFTFGTLAPVTGAVPLGEYFSPASEIEIAGLTFGGSTNSFQVTVVPEPTTALLLATGLTAVAAGRRRKGL